VKIDGRTTDSWSYEARDRVLHARVPRGAETVVVSG
jgi:hypothetical protein